MLADTMGTHEAAAYLRLHPRTLERKARAGLVPAARTGRKWLFRRSELDAWTRRLASPLPGSDAARWDAVGARELAAEYGPEDEGLYDDPEALGAQRVSL